MPPYSRDVHVLITGFGPFLDTKNNPSYASSKPLNGTTLSVPGQSVKIHITVIEVLVTYEEVMAVVTGLHAIPPVLPARFGVTPPPLGYQFVLHMGQGLPGFIALETIAHGSGYEMIDVHGKYAPIITNAKKKSTKVVRGPRSHGLDDELATDIDVEQLVQFLNKTDKNVQVSDDPGRYLCDFIFYASLAQAQLQKAGDPTSSPAKVLFMHVPPPEEPHTVAQMTETVKRLVPWVVANHVLTE
ncbi:peptidase C15, pyroglutamyl peptidase I-like protein [Auriculariales sp. MPI-PUGE-AT-0066]|nr:peptidase C15, pyroglutamyl peptidase I-like protein [Auriculariales sp. MPI-PUGE-AT-0066]